MPRTATSTPAIPLQRKTSTGSRSEAPCCRGSVRRAYKHRRQKCTALLHAAQNIRYVLRPLLSLDGALTSMSIYIAQGALRYQTCKGGENRRKLLEKNLGARTGNLHHDFPSHLLFSRARCVCGVFPGICTATPDSTKEYLKLRLLVYVYI